MSERWNELKARQPRLRDDVRVHRHRYRGQPWYLLQDPLNGRFQRIDARAYAIVRLLDGERGLGELPALLSPDATEDAAAAAILGVTDSLHNAGLIDWGQAPDAAALHQVEQRRRRAERLSRLRSPFSARLRLCNPDDWLQGLTPLARLVFSPLGCALWLTVVAFAGTVLFGHREDLAGYWAARGFSAQSVLLMAFAYVPLKLVHELAHGLAARRWGAEVREAGLMLLLLMPVPYVDVSSSWAFPEKGRRMIVGAAGILAELLVAAVAALVFVNVESGVTRDLAYTTVLVGSISTLVFNGNPLLRFDAYHVLADALEIPNLAPRSSRYWGYLTRRYLFAMSGARSPVSAPGERPWLFVYGLASNVYRVAVILGIALLVASELPLLGVLLAAWGLIGQLGVGLYKQVVFLLREPALRGRRARAVALCLGLAGTVVAVATLVPVPLTTHAQGVIWLPPSAGVRADVEGRVVAVLALPGSRVEAGAHIARLENPLLEARIQSLRWEIRELTARRQGIRVTDRVTAQVLAEQIRTVRGELDALSRERGALLLTSPVSGELVVPRTRQLEGRYVRKGEIVAHVLEDGPSTVRAVIEREAMGPVRQGVARAEVQLAQRPGEVFEARLVREVPKASRDLPGAALGTYGGGPIPVDPDDDSGRTAMNGVFVVDLTLDGTGIPRALAGGRAFVRLTHAPEPAAHRLVRGVRQLFLERLGV